MQGSRRNLPYYIENQNQNANLTTIVACSNHCGFQMIHIYKDRIIAFLKKKNICQIEVGKIWFSPFFDKIKFHLQLKESKENLEYLLLKVKGHHIPILFFFVKSGGLINFQVCVGIIFLRKPI